MIRLIARTRNGPGDPDRPRWLVIEGDQVHGFLVRAFRDLGDRQLFDNWVRLLDDAYEYGDAYGISKTDWRPRAEQMPGPLPFPDLGEWKIDDPEP